MAKKSSAPEVPVLESGDKPAPALSDVLRKEKNLLTYSMGVDPTVLIPIDSIGYEVMIQNTGFPVNCISMAIADAHAGKTTHSHVLGNWFTRAGGDVILAEGDGAFDETYAGRFYDYNPRDDDERFKDPLKHFMQAIAQRLDSEDPKKGIVIPQQTKIRLLAQMQLARAVWEHGKVEETNRLEKEVLFLAQCAYRARHVVRVEGAKTTEDLEKLVTTMHKRKLETDPKITRPTLLIVDPISNFIPNELAEQEDSASGRKMGMASYLNSFFRRWSKPLAQANIHLHLTAKKSTFISTNPYAYYSELEQLTTVGGGPQKLAASLLYQFEMGRKVPVPTADHEALMTGGATPFQDGRVKIPKKKIQGGFMMPKEFRTGYWLFTERNNTRMDFTLPFMEQVFKLNLFGITYGNGYVYVQPDFIPTDDVAGKHGDVFAKTCEDFRKKPVEKDKTKVLGVKMRRSDAVDLLTRSTTWRSYIHDILGIGHQDIGAQTANVAPRPIEIEAGSEDLAPIEPDEQPVKEPAQA